MNKNKWAKKITEWIPREGEEDQRKDRRKELSRQNLDVKGSGQRNEEKTVERICQQSHNELSWMEIFIYPP